MWQWSRFRLNLLHPLPYHSILSQVWLVIVCKNFLIIAQQCNIEWFRLILCSTSLISSGSLYADWVVRSIVESGSSLVCTWILPLAPGPGRVGDGTTRVIKWGKCLVLPPTTPDPVNPAGVLETLPQGFPAVCSSWSTAQVCIAVQLKSPR